MLFAVLPLFAGSNTTPLSMTLVFGPLALSRSSRQETWSGPFGNLGSVWQISVLCWLSAEQDRRSGTLKTCLASECLMKRKTFKVTFENYHSAASYGLQRLFSPRCKAVEKTRLMDVHGTGDRLRRLTEIQHPMLLPVTESWF